MLHHAHRHCDKNLAKVTLTMTHSFNFNDEKTVLKLYCLEGNSDWTKPAESETEDIQLQ
jgi:hypothetical protein